MKLRRYCVTVMDNWTPLRRFWTKRGALKFYYEHNGCSHLWRWIDGEAGGSWWEVPVYGPPQTAAPT